MTYERDVLCLKKNTWSSKIFTKRLFQLDTTVLEHTLYPCSCFATFRMPMEQYKRQTSLSKRSATTNPCAGWLTSVRRSSRQHLQAQHVTLRRGPWLLYSSCPQPDSELNSQLKPSLHWLKLDASYNFATQTPIHTHRSIKTCGS